MVKEIIKLNSAKKFKEVSKNKKEKIEPKIEYPLWEDKAANFLENKIKGAATEIFRLKKRDENIEASLSVDLEKDENFTVQALKIDKKRNWLVSRLEVLLKKKNKKDTLPYVFDDAAEKAMQELEQELKDPFAENIYNRLGKINKRILLDYLVDYSVNHAESKIVELPTVSEANDNVYAFSDNGYLLQLSNKEQVREGKNIKIDSEEAFYNLIAPDGRLISQNLKYQEAMMDIAVEADLYQKELKEEFIRQGVVNKNLKDKERELSKIEVEQINNKELEMNKIMDDFLEDEKSIILQKQKEKDFSNHPEKWTEEVSDNLEKVNEDNLENQGNEKNNIIFIRDSVDDNQEKKESFINPFEEKISRYANSIGIKVEELAANQEFLNLSLEQQQFALETLRRTSLAKAKVEGYQNFIKEKASKKWWQIGFAFNQNYHKERNKIEALKNIEKNGLAGYGEIELNWLVSVIKNGPEVQVNEVGEVFLNFLKEDGFTEEQKELVAEYNEKAREFLKNDGRGENIKFDLDDIKYNLINNAQTYDEQKELEKMFVSAQNNLELIKFLSANRETENVLNKMSKTSLSGVDRFKGMIRGQKDKAGYSALGFALRTGSNLALANSAYLASALTYSTAPVVAAIVGAFRGYNSGRQEINEKTELAQLGIADNSSLVGKLNLVSAKKETENGDINFGITEKLQNLSDRFERAYFNLNSEEDVEKLRESLISRISFTEIKMERKQIDYGSVTERNYNYLKLLETVANAKSLIGISQTHSRSNKRWVEFDQKLTRYEGDTNFLNKTETENNEEYHQRLLTYKKQENESETAYKKRIPKKIREYQAFVTDQKRIEELRDISVEDRLVSFLNLKETKQLKKERKFLIKKTATGALMAAGFAAVGQFLAEQLHSADWFSNKKIETTTSKIDKEYLTTNLETEPVAQSTSFNDEQLENLTQENISTEEPVTSMEETKISETVEKVETKNIKSKVASDFKQVESETGSSQTDSEINLERENITLEKIAIKPIEVEEVKAPDKIIIKDEFIPETQAVNIEEVSDASLVNENSASDLENNSLKATTEIEIPQESDLENVLKSSEELPSVENNSEETFAKVVATELKEVVDYGNKAAELADGVYGAKPGFDTEEAFLNKVEEINQIKLTNNEKGEIKNIFNNFKNNNDYNILRKRLVSFEKTLTLGEENEITDLNKNVLDVSSEKIKVNMEIAEKFKVEPEKVTQTTETIIYRNDDGSRLIIDSKTNSVKEAFDAKGKSIPEEFVKDLLRKKNLLKFSRREGLTKIFSSWDKLNLNDRLLYNNLNLFNKKTINSENLINQIKNLYQVETDNVSVDYLNKKLIISNGREFDLSLKGVKKMVGYLKRS